MTRIPIPSILYLGIVLALLASSASATTVVPIADETLILSSLAIVEGTVVAAESLCRQDDGLVYTYVTVDVEQTYSGDVPPGLVVLEQLGGETPDRVTTVFGAPRFEPGERAILFLNAAPDGALHVAHVMLGYFPVSSDPTTGRPIVRRPLSSSDGAYARRGGDDYVEFVDTLVATLASADTGPASGPRPRIVPDAYVEASAGGAPSSGFTFLGSGFRWFEPDSDDRVRMRVNPNRAPTPSRGIDESTKAFAAWSSVQGSKLQVRYAGETDATGIRSDDVNAISFGDPRNQIDDLVNCQGIVAIASITSNPMETVTIGRKRFARITEGDLVVNNGIECLLSPNLSTFEEVITHEFGHVLGLGHSSENPGETNPTLREATMYFFTHKDGRGANIRDDDRLGIAFLYDKKAGPLSLRTADIPNALPGEPYDFALKSLGGSSPYGWQLIAGSLPPGIGLGSDGHLRGTPETTAVSEFTVRLSDSDGSSLQRSFTLIVTRTPSPYLAKASFKPVKQKLVLNGWYLGTAVFIDVNGRTVIPPGVIKFKSAKQRLSAFGSADALNIDPEGENSVTVTIDGRRSNTLNF